MSEASPKLQPEVAAEPVATDRKRILLVEGDGFTRLVLLLRLRLAGFGVDFTSNGILGLGKLRTCHPDILLVELKLGGLCGLELIKAARAEPTFGNRPIYVFTHADRMNRTTRKEVGLLATELFDKSFVTREDVVQIFATTYLNREPAEEQPPASTAAELPASPLSEKALSGALEELIAGVRDQSEVLASETGPRVESGSELLSRVSSLASCAKAARLPNLARQAKALENFLNQLCKNTHGYTDVALSTVARAVEVMSRLSFTTGQQQGPSRFSAVFVDEEPYSNSTMEEALLNAGFDPVCFEDPGRAREHLAANLTDLIIANVVLPEGHGLALADIRQLPLHAETPVLFGQETSPTAPLREELPMSAPRLDKTPLLLTELVLRALNEVQGTGTSAPDSSVSGRPTACAARQPVATPNAEAHPPGEDGFELFAQAPRREEAPALDSSAQRAAVPAAAIKPLRFSHLFTAEGIPSEPILRTEPGTLRADGEAESLAQLPVTAIDGTQIDEQPLEASPPSALQAELPQPPQPEPTLEDQTAEVAWVAPATSDGGQAVLERNIAPELVRCEPAAVQELTAAPTDREEVMNNQIQAVLPECAQPGEDGQPGEALNEHQSPHQDLGARACAAENELYLAQQQLEQKDLEIEALQRQLADAKAGQVQALNLAAAPAEPNVAERKAQLRCAELEQEVAALRQAFENFNGSFGEQQLASAEANKRVQELEERLKQNAAELEKQRLEARSPATEAGAGAPASELEQQVRQGVAALARTTAELATERGQRQRSEQRAADLNGRLQALHQDLSRTLQVQRDDLARISALEEQQRQTSEALERRTADVEQHLAERRLTEEQLQKAKEVNAQIRKDLAFFEEANKKFDSARQELQTRLEASLNAGRENEAQLQKEAAERQRLAEGLEEARRELQNESRRRQTLEQELQTAHEALQDREAKLQKEAAERQRLNETLGSGQRGLHDGSQRDLEFSKLQSALQLEQVERNRQGTQLSRMRQSALDAAHAARALRTSLRRQVREPVDNLIHSARSLLELEMGDAQKKLAEAVLHDVLLVQTRLREPEAAHGDPPEATAPPTTIAT